MLAGSAIAHPAWQHLPQQAPYVSPIKELQALMDTGGLTPSARVVGAGCNETTGTAAGFPCKNVDLESFLPIPALGSLTGNDIWGWTDPENGDEYAIFGGSTATAFVEVTDPQNPVIVGYLPTAGRSEAADILWRDIKIYENHAFIVSEINESGMQVFDLKRLRDAAPGTIFDADAFYNNGGQVSTTHNLEINEESGYAYLVGNNLFEDESTHLCAGGGEGTEPEPGGLHMVDIRKPTKPKFAGCAIVNSNDPETGDSNNYAHDVDCKSYDESYPDPDYQGREICFGSNENAVVIYDVTEKSTTDFSVSKVISQRTYPTAAYTHQGALTEDGRFFLFGDELDEGIPSFGIDPTVENTTTYILPVDDLDNPGEVKAFTQESNTIDHNMSVHGNQVYQSNYQQGLRIFEFDNAGLAAGQLEEVAFFDVLPGADTNEFAGNWSNHRFPDSGTTVISTIEEETNGLFVLKPTIQPGPAPGSDDGEAPSGGDTSPGGDDSGGGGGTAGGSDDSGGGGDTGSPGGGQAGGACSNEIVGSKDSEKLNGTRGSDRLAGKGGRDRLKGGRGDDCLRGGGGSDRLNGGDDDDEIKSGRGKDRIKSGAGDDEIRARSGGRDRVNCGGGDDIAFVNDAKDRVKRNCETVRSR